MRHRTVLTVLVLVTMAVGLTAPAGASFAQRPSTQVRTQVPNGALGTSTIPVAAQRLLRDVESPQSEGLPESFPVKVLVVDAEAVVADLARPTPELCMVESLLIGLQGAVGKTAQPFGSAGVQYAAIVDADIVNLQVLILSKPASRACGGVSSSFGKVSMPVARVVSANNKQVTMRLVFPNPTFAVKEGDGTRFLEMFEQGFGNGGTLAIGTPELPLTGERIAVPQGALVSVQVLGSTHYKLPDVLLWPVQPSAPAAASQSPGEGPLDPPPPFTINRQAYETDEVTPRQLTTAGPLQSMRGLALERHLPHGRDLRPGRSPAHRLLLDAHQGDLWRQQHRRLRHDADPQPLEPGVPESLPVERRQLVRGRPVPRAGTGRGALWRGDDGHHQLDTRAGRRPVRDGSHCPWRADQGLRHRRDKWDRDESSADLDGHPRPVREHRLHPAVVCDLVR